jgi:23S rRNA pseudouridine2457 synthase
MAKGKKYYIVYKPKGCLSQFSKEHGKKALCDFFDLPIDVYPVGRLDEDSEGLLILTNDKSLNSLLLNPLNGHWRTYWVQLSGQVNKKAIRDLECGIDIAIKGGIHRTLPSRVKKANPPQNIGFVQFPIKNTSWLRISLQEGKNRQVRKMTAKVGFPTLRLIRTNIEDLDLGNMKPGDCKQIEKKMVLRKLKI